LWWDFVEEGECAAAVSVGDAATELESVVGVETGAGDDTAGVDVDAVVVDDVDFGAGFEDEEESEEEKSEAKENWRDVDAG
jgi:hypothetical protein